MTARDFCFWLQGMFELTAAGNAPPLALTEGQTATVKAHLALVFKHEIDPSQGTPEHQAELQKLHDALKEAAKAAPPKIGGVASDGTVYRC